MGKGGAKEKPNGEKVEVLIHGKYYDVTDFNHPGGSVIKFYAGKGIDATEAFDNFHVRSEKALKFLGSRPNRDADAAVEKAKQLKGQSELLEDFNKLTADLEKEGYFKPAYGHVAYRITEIILMHVVGIYLLFNGHYAAGIVITGIVCGRCGWLMHEGGHYSLTGNIKIDRFLQVWLYGVGCGMSGAWWRVQHNKHHSMPQKLGHDVDLETLPLLAFTSKVAKKCGFPQRFWIRMQAFCFPVITCLLVALGWQFYVHPRHIVRTKQYMEMAAFATRYFLWWRFCVPHFGVWGAIKVLLLYTWVGSNYIFINFAVSHTHLDTVPKEDTQVDWVRYSALYTMNVKPGPLRFINWWMSYLNFQIEHHLFPSMPQFRHPKISPRVKKLFEKHGLPYSQKGYIDALRVTFANLNKVGSDVFYG